MLAGSELVMKPRRRPEAEREADPEGTPRHAAALAAAWRRQRGATPTWVLGETQRGGATKLGGFAAGRSQLGFFHKLSRSGTLLRRAILLLVVSALVAACAGDSHSYPPAAPVIPTIELAPTGGGWSSGPLTDGLARVSNNGFGYTGEIDLYEIVVPATGRLQISLTWNHLANYDLIVAGDPEGHVRLAEGQLDAGEPEYEGIDVVALQTVYVFVAGWTGDAGPYVLETILLPPGTPVFAAATGPDLSGGWPSDLPLTFTFNADLDPEVDIATHVYFVANGLSAQGTWCLDGNAITFHPRLPETAADRGGLVAGERYTLQFPRASRGLKAVTGEYLTDIVSVTFDVVAPVDAFPGTPGITGILPAATLPYTGGTITLAVSEPLAPATVAVELHSVASDQSTTPVAATVHLRQSFLCSGDVEVRILVTPKAALPPGIATRLRLSSALGISGEASAGNTLPALQVDFPRP
jgi:hypothetical protein